jgi:hypothetical protein
MNSNKDQQLIRNRQKRGEKKPAGLRWEQLDVGI